MDADLCFQTFWLVKYFLFIANFQTLPYMVFPICYVISCILETVHCIAAFRSSCPFCLNSIWWPKQKAKQEVSHISETVHSLVKRGSFLDSAWAIFASLDPLAKWDICIMEHLIISRAMVSYEAAEPFVYILYTDTKGLTLDFSGHQPKVKVTTIKIQNGSQDILKSEYSSHCIANCIHIWYTRTLPATF